MAAISSLTKIRSVTCTRKPMLGAAGPRPRSWPKRRWTRCAACRWRRERPNRRAAPANTRESSITLTPTGARKGLTNTPSIIYPGVRRPPKLRWSRFSRKPGSLLGPEMWMRKQRKMLFTHTKPQSAMPSQAGKVRPHGPAQIAASRFDFGDAPGPHSGCAASGPAAAASAPGATALARPSWRWGALA